MTNSILIPTIDYKDWFINQKRIPDKLSSEAEPFFEFHKKLSLNGFYMGGEFFNPFLYWHLNLWHTEVDVIDELGRIGQKYMNPYLRDNEWLVTHEIHRSMVEKKGLCIGGIRRFSKTVTEASYIAWGATFDENSQNVIAGLNNPDIKLITDKIDKGLNFLPWYYKWDRVEDNWKNQVTLGIKTKTGERIPFSQILIRNLDEGNNEEAIAGTKPRKLIIDEGGKGSFLRGLSAAIPGFTTPFGWGCSPIVTFTGGDMQKFMDAKRLMFDVGAFNFLEYPNADDSKRVHGLFIGNKYRLEAKEESTLGAFLGKEEVSPLHNIKMQVGNEEKANTVLKENLGRLKKSGDRLAYLKEKMYFPENVDDIFLNEDTNIFPVEAAKIQKAKVIGYSKAIQFIDLFHDGEKINWKASEKRPIEDFPVRPSDSKDAPIVIFEHPVPNPPYGLYTIGVDPYRQGQAKYSDSLGSVSVYKRMHEINGELYQDMFVATYTARPENKEDWEEQARLLCKYYNGRVLCENDEISFIEYMKAKGDAHLLEKQPHWLREIVPNTTANREYGIHRSSDKIISYLHSTYKKYLEEVIHRETDEMGSVIREVLGIVRVLDPMLLEETIQFNEEDNFDRLISAELAIAQAIKMDPLIGKIGGVGDPRINALFNPNKPIRGNRLFKSNKTLFKPKHSKLFR